MKWSFGLFVIPLLLCGFVEIVHGIRCYQCSSKLNPNECTDDEVNTRFLLPCNETRKGKTATMCRKITQSVEKLLGMDADDRTIRTCGYETPHRDSYYRAGFGSRQLVATCYEDECNTAPAIPLTTAMLLSMIGVFIATLL